MRPPPAAGGGAPGEAAFAAPGPQVDYITQRLLESYGSRPRSVADFRGGSGSRQGSRPGSQRAPARRQAFSATLVRTAGARPALDEVDTRPLRPVSALAEPEDGYTGRAHRVYLASREAERRSDGLVLEGVIASRIRSGARPVATTRPISGASLAGPTGRSPSPLDGRLSATRARSAPLWASGGASGLLGTASDTRASLRLAEEEAGPDPASLLPGAPRAPARPGPGEEPPLRTYGAQIRPLQRNVTADRASAGLRALHVNSFRYSLSSLSPASRPALVNPALHLAGDVRPLTSILTPQMTLAASDLALRMQEMKLRCEGLDLSRMDAEQRAELERRYAAFGTAGTGGPGLPGASGAPPRRPERGREAARQRREAAADALRQNRNHMLSGERGADRSGLRFSARMALQDASAMREKLPVVFQPEGYSLRAGGLSRSQPAPAGRDGCYGGYGGYGGYQSAQPLRATAALDFPGDFGDLGGSGSLGGSGGLGDSLGASGASGPRGFGAPGALDAQGELYPLDSPGALQRPQSFSERAAAAQEAARLAAEAQEAEWEERGAWGAQDARGAPRGREARGTRESLDTDPDYSLSGSLGGLLRAPASAPSSAPGSLRAPPSARGYAPPNGLRPSRRRG